MVKTTLYSIIWAWQNLEVSYGTHLSSEITKKPEQVYNQDNLVQYKSYNLKQPQKKTDVKFPWSWCNKYSMLLVGHLIGKWIILFNVFQISTIKAMTTKNKY